ncbi:MAG TPA: hypothetical protein VH743_20640 [Beijerinckiaceae bacterium]
MTPHRFAVGQTVTYSQVRFPTLISGAECVIVRLLPTRFNGPEYLVRCKILAFELIVGEQELTVTEPPPARPQALAA